MAYTDFNYQSKKALVEAFKAGKRIHCHQPGGMFPLPVGKITLEGPHYPKPHRWYATAVVDNEGYITSVK